MKIKKSIRKASSLLLLAFSVFKASFAQDIRPLSEINSPYNESHAVRSPLGELYFSVGYHPENTGGTTDSGDIWMSQPISNGKWSKPARIKPLSTPGNDVVVGFTGPSNILIYHDGQQMPQGIHMYSKNGNNWRYEKKLNIPDFKNQSSHFSGRLAADGKSIIMSLQKDGGEGNEDIYITFKKSETEWTTPLNLGPIINTFGQEQTPYLTNDNNTLYFSSNFKANGRGKDIYYAQRRDESWKNWSQPKELSTANTIGSESNYAKIFDDEDLALFTTTSNSEGMGDFMVIAFEKLVLSEEDSVVSPEDFIALNQDQQELPISDSLKQEIVSSVPDSISGPPAIEKRVESRKEEVKTVETETVVKREIAEETKVVNIDPANDKKVNREEELNFVQIRDQRNKKPIDYRITIADDVEKKVLKNQDEMQQEWEKWNWNYIEVSAKGYIPNSLTVEEWQHLKDKTLQMVQARAGARKVLSNIQFIRGTADLADARSIQELDLLVDFMKENEQVKIRLEGHTDNAGDPELNKELSLSRASKIRAYMTLKGIDFERIRITGWGGSKPIADNATEQGREINRRVEMYIDR
ncbi:OmpA family protein [Cecembia calidifontis]|jgi:outer membrane protein OmpA-like peptidoglycan-associated protein|uniref:WD40 repeat protein n=1 Tax=Cecembia calidifontis TaxID=1187080 RepID=A0A4Q7PBH9_9BACT|nr:OmpA family protein [Cecembia calidifontis]RZS97565.1 WD40 repeat protein [Cecembia calidifontis]